MSRSSKLVHLITCCHVQKSYEAKDGLSLTTALKWSYLMVECFQTHPPSITIPAPDGRRHRIALFSATFSKIAELKLRKATPPQSSRGSSESYLLSMVAGLGAFR